MKRTIDQKQNKKEYDRDRYLANKDRILAQTREYYGLNRQHLIDAMRKNQKTEQNKAKQANRQKEDRKKNPEKFKARSVLNNAVISGKVGKTNFCEDCGSYATRIEGHHEDYSAPLDVNWLCNACHKIRHK